MNSLSIAAANLTSIPVLVFVIAVIAARLKTDIRLPEPIYQGIAIFLLLGIGLKGGHALKASEGTEFLWPALAALALGIVIPFIAYGLLRVSGKLSRIDRASMAAHYGSTSLVTFTAALVMLESLSIFVEPFLAALLAIMEIPGIVVGIYLGARAMNKEEASSSLRESLREVLLGKTVLILVAGLLVGFIAPEASFAKVEPFFVALQPGILVLFLLQLGFLVGSRLETLKHVGIVLPLFAVVMPVLAGSLGAVVGSAIGLGVGGTTMLAVLCASASYIAAPAAVEIAMPKANLSVSLTASLGITFPFNLLVGLPLYLWLANLLNEVM